MEGNRQAEIRPKTAELCVYDYLVPIYFYPHMFAGMLCKQLIYNILYNILYKLNSHTYNSPEMPQERTSIAQL